jgi:hypothetical protein
MTSVVRNNGKSILLPDPLALHPPTLTFYQAVFTGGGLERAV